jgi:hypothetical protein
MQVRLLVAAAAVLSAAVVAPPATSAPAPDGHRASRAGTVINLGQTGAPNVTCPANSTTLQIASTAPVTYVTPIAGVITSVSYSAGPVPGLIRLVFLKPGAVAGHYDVVGYHSEQAVTASTLNVFPTRIKIGAGVTLALHTSTVGMACGTSGFTAAEKIGTAAFDPVLSTDLAPAPVSGIRLDLAVTLEPDADNDGYGDVTQDLCPTSDLTHGSCDNVITPDTSFSKKPAKHGTKRKIKATFTSTVAGSTFECSIDQRAFKPCTSPYTKKVGYGKHILKVQAVGPAGLVDPSPATCKFRVNRPPR